MDERTPKELFLQSLERCMTSEEFIPAFYERFLTSSEEVKRRFRFTDFDKQNKLLRRALQLCAGATSGEPESLREITERATTHDRHHLNIEPKLYVLWLDAIVATASGFDDQWGDDVEEAWSRILGHVVQHMIRKY